MEVQLRLEDLHEICWRLDLAGWQLQLLLVRQRPPLPAKLRCLDLQGSGGGGGGMGGISLIKPPEKNYIHT